MLLRFLLIIIIWLFVVTLFLTIWNRHFTRLNKMEEEMAHFEATQRKQEE